MRSRPDGHKIALTTFLVHFILQFTEGVQWFYFRKKNTFKHLSANSMMKVIVWFVRMYGKIIHEL